MREEDAEIGLLALEKGLLSQDVLNNCLAAISEEMASLAEIFQERRLLTIEQIERLRAEAIRRIEGRRDVIAPAGAKAVSGDGPEIPREAAEALAAASNRFLKFVLVRELGRGPSGRVWKAWDTRDRRWVALKMFSTRKDRGTMARFLKEAETVQRLIHPRILAVLESGWGSLDGEDRGYVVHEYTDGASLEQVQARGLSFPHMAQILRDAALAAAHAHERGILHRNLKPRNILVGTDGLVRVADFGQAAHVATLGPGGEVPISRTVEVLGDPSYMPPEQVLGRLADIGERSDVYSLGATLYFLLTGQAPFERETALKAISAVVRETLTPPAKFNPKVPPDLDRVVMRSMAKDPIRRYASAAALAEDLDRFIRGGAVLTDDQLMFTQGLAALHAGRLEEAVHMCKELMRREVAERTGGDAGAGLVIQLEKGIEGLSLAIERQTKNYDIRMQRGVYRFAKAIIQSLSGGDPSESCRKAMEDFVDAAALRPEYTPARVNRANVLIFGGRYARDSGRDVSSVFEMAILDLDEAIRFDPTSSAAFHNRGIVRFYMARGVQRGGGDPEPAYRKAIDDFEKAAELEPTYPYIFKDLGVVKVTLAKHLLSRGVKVKPIFEEAVAHLNAACDLSPDLYGAFYERGQARFALKDFRGALGDFRHCQKIDPSRDRQIRKMIGEAERYLAIVADTPFGTWPSMESSPPTDS